MLDRLRLFIPFRPQFVTGGAAFLDARAGTESGHKGLVPDLKQFGAPVRGAIEWDEGGHARHSDLKIPIHTLPSSFTPMGFAAHLGGNMWPGIELRASPAKLLQGHNLFGPDDIGQGGFEMLALLNDAYPSLYSALEIESTEVWELDSTFGVHVPNDEIERQVIGQLRFVSNGQRKARGDTYSSTAYWGAKESRLLKGKAYLKQLEFQQQLKEYQRKARTDAIYRDLVSVCSDSRLHHYAKNLLRFEATIMKRWLERHDIPTNFFQLAKYQRQCKAEGRDLMIEFFKTVFDPIFATFEGMTMRVHNDEEVLEQLKAKFGKTGKGGKVSYSAALGAFRTYRMIAEDGWEATKATMSERTFNHHVKMITEAGLSKAYLQNLQRQRKTNNVFPLLRFVNIDFANQHPDWYVAPVSRFQLKKVA